MIDQAWLSALNLALGLVLIRLATKETYGIYAQLYVGALFVVSVSDSLIINPLTTRLNNGNLANRLPMIGASSSLQGRLALALSALAGLGALAIGISTSKPMHWRPAWHSARMSMPTPCGNSGEDCYSWTIGRTWC